MKAREDSVVRIMLKDEYNRTISIIQNYKNEINKLPKGSLYYKKKKRGSYVYLSFRENGKPKTKYVGKENCKKHQQLQKAIKLRKYYEDVVKKVEFEKKEIELYLKVGEKFYE